MTDNQNNNQNLKLLGEKIRLLRQHKGINITEFAEMTGVTSAYISQIERNLIEPSLTVLRNLAEALNVEIPLLFSNEMPADVLVTTEANRSDVIFVDGGVRFQFMMPSYLGNGNKPDLSVMILRLGSKEKDSREFAIHNNTEFALVLQGCIEYQTDKDNYRLFEGDSIYLEKNVPHNIYNPYDEEAVFFAVMPSVPPHLQQKK